MQKKRKLVSNKIGKRIQRIKTAGIICILFLAIFISPASAESINIVSNPGFESGTSPWIFYTDGSGSFLNDATGDGSTHAGNIAIYQLGTNVQLYQRDLVLEPDTLYSLNFKAYSNLDHNLSVLLLKHGSPYTNYGLSKSLDIGTTWGEYSIQFKTVGFSNIVNDARLTFWLANYNAVNDQFYFDDVILTKVSLEPIQPTIITHPSSQVIDVGQNATFNVTASDTGLLSYQWKKNDINITGATSDSYTTPPVSILDNGSNFSVVVTNSNGSITSNPAELTVVPVEYNQLSNPGFESGTFPWAFYTDGSGSFLNDATGDGSPQAGHIVISRQGTNVQLYQRDLVLEPDTLYRLDFKAYSNIDHEISVLLFKHGSPYTNYGLSKSFNIGTTWGAYSIQFETAGFPAIVNDARLMFWLAAYDAVNDQFYFDDVLLTKVSTQSVQPTIITHPSSQVIGVGQNATFSVTVSGTAPLSYQWMKNGINIPGATLASYTTPSASLSDNGSTYLVNVTNNEGSVISDSATLTVILPSTAPTITTQPLDQTVTAGQIVTFTVAAIGTAPLSYQWQKNGVNIPGATSSMYTTPATTMLDNGNNYRVNVTNNAGNVISDSATLTVILPITAPIITTQPLDQTVRPGQIATFGVIATGTAPLSYQWQKNGVNIPGATNAMYTTPATTASDNGNTYRVNVTNNAGSVTSNPAKLTVVNDKNLSASFSHLSSKNGDIPSPGISTEQTASLVLDIDRDGINDFIIGSRNKGPSIFWFKKNSVGWTRYLIENDTLSIEAGGAFQDIDGDGDQDIVFGGDWQSNKVWWWENPYPSYDPDKSWIRREIKNSGLTMHHDEIFGDFDSDGKKELVFWNQYAKKLLIADIPSNPKDSQPWPYNEIWSDTSRAEGLASADVNGDGKLEIIGGGRWFKNDGGKYLPYIIDANQQNSRAAAGDLKTGGLPEIVMVPGDSLGRLKWYECNGNPEDPGCWVGHDLLGFDIDHGHSLDVIDINGDGNLDIFVAEMRLNGGNSDSKMLIFWGDGNGNFKKEDIAQGYDNHESKAADLDGDGDIDILGKPYNFGTPGLDIWLNNPVSDISLDSWERQVVDSDKPWRAVFITSEDMDNDGNKDIITGGWWYKNPGLNGNNWTRHTIGTPLNNMAAVYDFDGDGDMDVLGTQGKGSDPNAVFVWGRNDGSGNFEILNNIEPGDGDFLQGAAVGNFKKGGPVEIALSWHQDGKGIQMLTPPSNPSIDMWTWRQISTISQDEALSQGDIDRDGNIDLLLGTKWLRNDGISWMPYTTNPTGGSPDRNKLADINGDGRLDAVVGFEAISIPGKLAWYEQGVDAKSVWNEHIIANVVGPMSLDVVDIENDGDMDVVVGEHNLITPSDAKLFVFENSDGKGNVWNKHLVYTGDEHHDGAQVVDIDNDGDRDIISIGWSHGRVQLYKNKDII